MVAYPVHSCQECYSGGYHKACQGAGCEACEWTGTCRNLWAAFIKANGGVNPMTRREYSESELESLQCAPFHAPIAVEKSTAVRHCEYCQAILGEFPDYSTEPDGTTREFCSWGCWSKHQRRLDSPVFAQCLKNATRKKWEVVYRESHLDAYFMCYQEETGVKLRTATMEPSYWTTTTIREHADIIAEIFRQEQAGE